MAFKTKQDYYGIAASASGLTLVATSENRTSQVAEAQGEDGFVVATESFGDRAAPNCDYVVTDEVSLTSIVLGDVTTISQHNYVLGGITINTQAGSAPTVQASGSQVEDGSGIDGCTATMPSVTISPLHHAQTFGAFTYSGTGAHLTQSTFTAECTVSTADKDGVPLAHDIVGGKVTVTGTIQVSNSSYGVPTVTPSNGWSLTSPLTETNPDGDFPTYTFGLTNYLSAD